MAWEVILVEKGISSEMPFLFLQPCLPPEIYVPPIGMMMPADLRRNMNDLVSVITPTRLKDNRVEWLIKLNQSLVDQGAEHVIIVDRKDSPSLPSEIQANVIYTQKNIGQAVSRNIGLNYAKGGYITSADDDDVIPHNSLKSRLESLLSVPEAHWACGYLSDLRNGTELSLWEHKAHPGIYQPKEIFGLWEEPLGEFPLPPTGMLVKKESLLAAGGWGGLSQAEDFFMVLAVTNRFPGVVIEDVVYHYRKHHEQMMNTPDFDLLEEESRKFCFNVSTYS